MALTIKKLNEYWDYLIDHCIATEEELDLITSINGFTEETLNDILYVRTAYRDLEQYKESEEE